MSMFVENYLSEWDGDLIGEMKPWKLFVERRVWGLERAKARNINVEETNFFL